MGLASVVAVISLLLVLVHSAPLSLDLRYTVIDGNNVNVKLEESVEIATLAPNQVHDVFSFALPETDQKKDLSILVNGRLKVADAYVPIHASVLVPDRWTTAWAASPLLVGETSLRRGEMEIRKRGEEYIIAVQIETHGEANYFADMFQKRQSCSASLPCVFPPDKNGNCWQVVCTGGSCRPGPTRTGLSCQPRPNEVDNTHDLDCFDYECASSGLCTSVVYPNSPEVRCNKDGNYCTDDFCKDGYCSIIRPRPGPCQSTPTTSTTTSTTRSASATTRRAASSTSLSAASTTSASATSTRRAAAVLGTTYASSTQGQTASAATGASATQGASVTTNSGTTGGNTTGDTTGDSTSGNSTTGNSTTSSTTSSQAQWWVLMTPRSCVTHDNLMALFEIFSNVTGLSVSQFLPSRNNAYCSVTKRGPTQSKRTVDFRIDADEAEAESTAYALVDGINAKSIFDNETIMLGDLIVRAEVSNSASPPDDKKKGGGGLEPYQIALIVIGVILLLVVIAGFLVYVFVYARPKDKKAEDTDEMYTPLTGY